MPLPAVLTCCPRAPALLPLALAAALLTLPGCASLPAGPAVAAPATPGAGASSASTPAAKTTPSAAPAATGAAPAQAGQPRPFAEVVRDAKESPGLFRLWQKDDKIWLEITPEQFGVAYFFTSNLNRGIGEKRLVSPQGTDPHKVAEKVYQLILEEARLARRRGMN